MPATKAHQRAVNKYIKGNYDRLNLTMQKGAKSLITAAALSSNESVNGYIKKAIKEHYEADTGKTIEL